MDFDHLFDDRDSFASQLIRQKARQLVRHPAFRKSEREDLEQELASELVWKYRCFDPDRARETTFIARVLENKVISLIRTRVAEKRDFRRNAYSLNETVCDADGSCEEIWQTLDQSAARNHTQQTRRSDEELLQMRLDFDEVLSAMPSDLHKLATLLKALTEFAASRALGKSRRQVSNDMARLRELFEDGDLRDYL